jgi:hypothetical protein
MRATLLPRLASGATLLFIAFLGSCGDLGGNLNGCTLTRQSGEWFTGKQGSFEYYPTFNSRIGCPVRIVRPTERVITSGNVVGVKDYDGDAQPTEQAVLQVWNSANYGLAADIFRFRRTYIDEIEATLVLEYDAATALRSFNDTDRLRLVIRDWCCAAPTFRAEVELEVNYFPDGLPRVAVEGTEIPLRSTTQTWEAVSINGGRPHQYQWYRNATWVASGASYTAATGTTDFVLRVDMTDAYGRTASGSMNVDVDGIRATIRGPTQLVSEAGFWTASATGGYPPYSFTWYKDGIQVGQGSSYSALLPAGSVVSLAVKAQDSRGVAHSYVQSVTVETQEPCGGEIAC